MTSSPWTGRSHPDLAELARELLLAGHLIDRAGMPHLIGRFGREVMGEVAIEEWANASPIYARRMQRLLGFEGDTVETIFKGMQLDIGAPPEFMDFRYTVHDDHRGEFHLAHCGALMDVEPMGDDYVTTMCHDIEDPTFDATAAATNPRAKVRPLHRPPRSPADRQPHCAWTVTIDPDPDSGPADPSPTDPTPENDRTGGSNRRDCVTSAPQFEVVVRSSARMSECRAATLPLASADPTLGDDDGWTDYAQPLDPDLVLERFSSAILDEVALQGHLLSRAFLLEVAERSSGDEAVAIGIHQAIGIAGLTSKRLAAALQVEPDLAGVAQVLRVHPLLAPRSYVDLRLIVDTNRLTVALGPCPALAEPDGLTWPALLVGDGGDAILASAVQCLVPTAEVRRVPIDPNSRDAVATWGVTVDSGGEAVDQPDDVTLAEFSTGATFTFRRSLNVTSVLALHPASTMVSIPSTATRRGSA